MVHPWPFARKGLFASLHLPLYTVVMVETPTSQPRAGVDYPRNLIEFGEFFPDDKACVAYLERLRWAEGFVCPEGHVAAAAWRSERGLSVCPTCRRQVSATAGTILEGTRKLQIGRAHV